jgi:hypothetical protein
MFLKLLLQSVYSYYHTEMPQYAALQEDAGIALNCTVSKIVLCCSINVQDE